MRQLSISGLTILWLLCACSGANGTEPPQAGWANTAPTVVERTVDRPSSQLLKVKQGSLEAWVEVPAVGAKAGDYVLLGQGSARYNVEIPELGEQAAVVVDIAHVQVVNKSTAMRTVAAHVPTDAISIEQVYAQLDRRAGQEVLVYGTVVKATSAVGSTWVHLQDGTGDPEQGTHDLTVQTQESVVQGQRLAFRGTLRKDVDLGFGYHYDALIEDGVPIR